MNQQEYDELRAKATLMEIMQIRQSSEVDNE